VNNIQRQIALLVKQMASTSDFLVQTGRRVSELGQENNILRARMDELEKKQSTQHKYEQEQIQP